MCRGRLLSDHIMKRLNDNWRTIVWHEVFPSLLGAVNEQTNQGVIMNKVLNIIAWIAFALAVLSYVFSDLPFEGTFFILIAIFLVIAPRHSMEAFN